MIRVSMFYPHTPEMHFDLDYFLTRHVPLMESLLTPEGLLHVEVDRGLAMSDPALPVQFAVIAYLTFHGYEEMQTAMGTHSEQLLGDLLHVTNSRPVVQINQVTYKATMEPVEV